MAFACVGVICEGRTGVLYGGNWNEEFRFLNVFGWTASIVAFAAFTAISGLVSSRYSPAAAVAD
eukprot:COSAG01_NODE_68074_length_265_cov_0.620482_1_plen_63_part_01